ncbi:Di-trans-poly-cis-decaprenylcistransferase, partial [Metschnikowia bicuspidata var. bicuspidata NRRL YB-4993]
FVRHKSIEILKQGRIPKHVGFIMDGNRRYAKEKGLFTKEGHKAGAEALKTALESCYEIGIKEISIYAFSIENFKRPKSEIDDILSLLRKFLESVYKTATVSEHNIQVRIIGNRSLIEPSLLEDLEKLESETKTSKVSAYLNVCFAYTSRDEITHSVREVVGKHQSKDITKNEICERLLTENLYTRDPSQPLDILLRTSGHTRLSDFLLWQCTSNCSIVFLDTLWPDFSYWELYLILLKWSFEQAVMRNRHLDWGFSTVPQYVNLKLLPDSPPFASVAEK